MAVVALVAGVVACDNSGEQMTSNNIRIYNTTMEIAPEGETIHVNYAIEAPREGEMLVATCQAEWIEAVKVYSSFVAVTAQRNTTGEVRTAHLELTYGTDKCSITLTQQPFVEPISIRVEATEAVAVVVSVETASAETTWIGQIVDKEWFEAYTDEEKILEDRDYFYSMAEEEGITFEQYIAKVLNKGSHNNLRMGGLDPETDYVMYVYGMNNIGEATTAIYHAPFTTTAPYQGNDVTFDIEVVVNRAVATVSIEPSHEGVAYFNNLITREDFEAYGSIEAAADGVIAKIIEDYAAWDYSLAETFEYNTDYLATTYEFEAMANTEYVAFAFKWNDKCQRLSEVSYTWFEVGDIPPSDNEITAEISNVTQTTFDIVTTTTNLDPYIIFPIPAIEISKMRSDETIFNYLMQEYGTWELEYYICEGDVKGTFSSLKAGTEYAVLIFGYEAGVRTTKIKNIGITTAQAGDIEACQYNIEVSNVGDREAMVKITPSDYSIWYYWNVFEASATEEEIKAFILDSYNKTYYADYWEFSYYELAQGAVESGIGQLMPNTDYKIVIIPMNPDEFEYTGTMREGGAFTTEEAIIADIKIEVALDEYYDGDEAYAIEPDYMSSWQGWVIIPLTVKTEGACAGYLYTIFNYVDGLEDPAVYSDDRLIDNLYEVGATWSPAYFRGVWDTPLMIAAVAFDSDGNPSPVYRECFTCTHEGAGDAQEWIDYYMGTIKTYAAPSLVIGADNCHSHNIMAPQHPTRQTQSRETTPAVRFAR
jgi:hypothetical protein